jgi:hypothetical protein
MHARRAGFLLGMIFCGSCAAAQETQVSMNIVPDVARATTGRGSLRRFALPDEKSRDSGALPRSSQIFSPEVSQSVPAPVPRYRFEMPASLAPLRVTAERSGFLTEARIPLAQMWNGRLRFSGVQQRFHAANLYSVANPAGLEEVSLAPGIESIVGRARVNFGVGLQFRFGR